MIKYLFFLSILLVPNCFWSQTDSTQKIQMEETSNVLSPVFSSTGADAESALNPQDVSSLLQASRDVFAQFASFQWSASNYSMRGFTRQNQSVMINGINIINLETGSGSWSSWGGLNDVSRFIETGIGNVSNRYRFSGPGGYVNIDSHAASFKRGMRFSYANANKTFRNRFMLTYASGALKNGWAIAASVSNRYGNQVYLPGTYFKASSFYLSIDKRINNKQLLSFTGFTAPVEQGLSTYETAEAYRLAGSHYYNSNWGLQNGKVRNASVNKTTRPMFLLSHIYSSEKNAKLTTSIFYTFGKQSRSALNWNNTLNPRPDYYRYLPDYYYRKEDLVNGDQLTEKWMTDVNTRQINWDRMIALNRANLYALPSQLGQTLVTNQTRARYILEDQVENLKHIGFNSVYNKRYEKLFLSVGCNASHYQNRKYKVLNDLLGATYWLDYDQFAQNTGVDNSYQQNDISNPDRKVYKGDKFGYDYAIHIQEEEFWSQMEYSVKKVDAYAGVTLSDQTLWRQGFVANGKFPSTSKGISSKLNFVNAGIKTGITYKISGRHFITINASALTRPPQPGNLFISPNVRNDVATGFGNERVISSEINYLVKYTRFKMRVTYYNTQINNQFRMRTYWHDEYNTNVDLLMKGINENHQGLEVGLEKTLLTSHALVGTFGLGRFIYTNRPLLDAWQDNTSQPLFKDRIAYLKNYKIGNSPQLVSGIGYKYTAKKHWFAAIHFNYVDQIYVEPNPDRRTQEALANYVSSEVKEYSAITKQERLHGYFFINMNTGSSFRIHRKYILNISLSINNLLNNKNSITSGYEQLRWDAADINRFANKYSYMMGTTYTLLINLNF